MKNSHQLAQEAIENFHKPDTELFAYWQGGAIDLNYLLQALIKGKGRYIKAFDTLEEAVEYSKQWRYTVTKIRITGKQEFEEMVYYWDELGEVYL